ncbi:MAG: Amidohydrolase 3, partial [Phenylobacterium sp.]|nr:Amidohydrolase 3 [Phenylobacterium sp.]
ERVDRATALGLYLGEPADPGVRARRVEVGAPADLCLLASPLPEALTETDAARVRATVIGGELVHQARG